MKQHMSKLVAGAVVIGLTFGHALPASADLRVETEITYTANVHDGHLHLQSDLKMTNLTPNKRDGYQIIRYYYDAINVFIPETAVNVIATSGDRELDVTLTVTGEPEDDGFLLAEIKFGRRIFYKRTFEMSLEYDIPGDLPRSDSVFRVNPAYFNFGVVGWGDTGYVTVNIVTPEGFSVVFDEEELEPDRVEDGMSIFTVTDIEDLEEFFINVRGWNEDALRTREVMVEDVAVTIRSWPGDREWADEVEKAVKRGMPELLDLVGLDWVTDEALVISQLQDVNLAGYGGWYLVDENVIDIGEWVDPWLVLHELSHAWFNQNLFEERWINEGLAEEFSLRAVQAAGLDDVADFRNTYSPPRTSLLEYLNDWEVPDFDDFASWEIDTYEQFGYDASFWVIQEITEEIGVAALALAVQAAAADQIAYQGEVEPEMVDPDDDWRRLLDLLEELGGSETATDLFMSYVTDADLADRAETRGEYHELLDHGDDWAAPFFVREAMSDWEFDVAAERIEAAGSILDARDQIEANYETLGVSTPSTLEDAYEAATDQLEAVEDLAEEQLEATDQTLEAKERADAEPSFVETVGLIGEDVAAEYSDVIDALEDEDYTDVEVEAAEIIAIVDGAAEAGQFRLIVSGSVILVLAGGVTILLVRRKRKLALASVDDTEGMDSLEE